MKRRIKDQLSQFERFAEAARAAECDEDEAAWEERLRKVAKSQPKAETKKPAK